ncbi:pilus assembly protein TadG-related protein [Robbsia sp. Bb-Pol-6]|uniref:Pilus assembly protein TadG-related protein n=1 Tax=Robbsia betulipollinis TaxID=2981849 RepID=A0ABT3ZNR1_9BURK|nr:pilus assembly protein TadG-related protein [Robbsia betulipollinis]MCY0388165.1 pilus assembly protein TadG-related protein [Robbsia betulipollinis]
MTTSHRQSGGIAITMAIFLLVAVVLLESLALGYAFYLRRKMQTVADFSALAGAQQLSGTDCTTALKTASANGALNGVTTTFASSCGRWNAAYTSALHYQPQTDASVDPNAVYVSVSATLPWVPSWMPSSTIGAQAIAIRNGSPVAVFSIASGLLSSQLGCVAACGAIASANFSVLDFLRALGIAVPTPLTVGGLTTLLSTNPVTYAQVVGAIGSLTGLSNLSSVLRVSPTQANLPVQLLTTASVRGLFTFDTLASSTDTAGSILGAQLNALSLVTTAVGVADRNSAIGTTLGAGGITAQVNVVAPPSIGMGGVGASAYSGQIRVYAHVTTAGITGSAPLLGLLASVDLPIEIDVADASATITSLCTAKNAGGADTATFSVSTPLLQACVGALTESTVKAGTSSCASTLTPQTVLSLVSGLATVKAGFTLAALPNTGSYTLAAGQTAVTTGNNLVPGTALSQILTGLDTQLVASLLPGSASVSVGTVGTTTSTGSTGTSTIATALAPAGTTLNAAAAAINASLASLTSLSTALGGTGLSVLSGTQTSLLRLLQGTASAVATLTSAINPILGGLLGGTLGPCGIVSGTGTAAIQACVASKLSGTASGSGTPNALLFVTSAVANLLQPALTSLAASLSSGLTTLFGTELGAGTLNLISLNCIGTDVRLVQ